MNLTLSDEQLMLQEAAAGALARVNTVDGARRALDGEPLPDLWPTAIEAGWTGLLVAEEHGGTGLELFDAMLVAEQCGKRLAGAKLYGHLVATYVLEDHEILAQLASGELRAAFAASQPQPEWTIDADGRVTGSVRYVPDLAGADVIVLVAADEDGEPVTVLLRDVEATEVVRFDASRPLGELTLDGAPGEIVGRGAEPALAGWLAWQALLAADALGVCQTVLEMGVAYAKDRHAFGRPIGSYQAVKHQLVEILRWIDTTRNLCFFTGYAAQEEPQQLALAASCARFAAEQASDYATRTCIAVHGGIGATWEHDAPFYWRRAQLSRLLLGGLDEAGERVASEIIASAQATAGAR